MSHKLFALIVGIDNYPLPQHRLYGCVNDATAVREFLQARAASPAKAAEELNLVLLTDKDATRQAVIDGIRNHLGRAGKGDVAFFHFSGHGSQELTCEAFRRFEPDGLNETLVCYDSRLDGGWDLADKELAFLLRELADRKPHLTVLLDCCHSGSGTRDTQAGASRHIPARPDRRPADSYLFAPVALEQLRCDQDPVSHPTSWGTWRGGADHVLLAACRDAETAKECFADGRRAGAFTYYLLETLRQAGRELTYREVFRRASALVRANVTNQMPQLETFPPAAANDLFLGGRITPLPPHLFVRRDPQHGWVVDAGRVHGIREGVGDERTVLALFPGDNSLESLDSLDGSAYRADVVKVLPHLSTLRFQGMTEPAPDEVFKAVVIQLPLLRRAVRLEGDQAGLVLVREALATAAPGGGQSLFVNEATTENSPTLVLQARDDSYLIRRPGADWPLVIPIPSYGKTHAALAVRRLEHIARWENVCNDLHNAHGRVKPGEVRLTVECDGAESTGTIFRLQYVPQPDGSWKQPTFRLRLQNQGKQPLYCTLLTLSEDFSIRTGLIPGGGVWLQPGQEAWALNGDPVYASVPKDWWQKGITSFTDTLKLIVSTQAFDATLLEQEPLDIPPRVTRSALGVRRSTLNRLMARVQVRSFSDVPEANEKYDDWTATEVSFLTIRPLNSMTVPRDGPPMPLAPGVSLDAHATLQAKVRLDTLPQAARDLGNIDLPAVLKDDAALSWPLLFSPTRGADPGLQVLELTEVVDYQAVTPDQPLRLHVAVPLGEGEAVLPVAFDGEFFLPLGFAEPAGSNGLTITLERLPHPVARLERSLLGSIRIFFQKVSSSVFRTRFDYPLLAIPTVSGDHRVDYELDPAHVRARVAGANRVLLFIHGITGDTRSMAGCIPALALPREPEPSPLGAGYDLVLTFDYESLNTNLEIVAAGLADRLRQAGLGPDHGKVLDVVAHSMGGLVARWFIERMNGSSAVRRLIMLGTPNAGSPWPIVHQWGTFLLTVGLNSLAPTAWTTKALARLVPLLRPLTVDLGQMKPGSDFLRSLAGAPDPGIPYFLVAGDTSKTEGFGDAEQRRLERLLDLFTTRKILHTLADPFFLESPNDVAVSVASMMALPPGRQSQVSTQVIACDHMSYFNSTGGLKALGKVLGGW